MSSHPLLLSPFRHSILLTIAAGAFALPAASMAETAPPIAVPARTPGFSTRAGECLETMREALAAHAADEMAADPDSKAHYLSNEQQTEAALASMALRNPTLTDEKKEGAPGAPSSEKSRVEAVRPPAHQR